MTAFGERLREAMSERGPLCVGIDPHPSLLERWGLTDTVDGLERFALGAAQALAPVTAVVKPQSAFFERFGSRGIAVLERTIVTCREAGAQVLLDVKRGDIGSTVQAYADAYLDASSPLAVDAITASPFLGFGALTPLFEVARANDAGVFVLALTSNPEGRSVQQARFREGTVAGAILAELRALNTGADTWGAFGAVVGANIDPPEEDLRINGALLAPGVGAQGGDAASCRKIFDGVLDQVLPTTSRAILTAGPDESSLRAAVDRAVGEFRELLG